MLWKEIDSMALLTGDAFKLYSKNPGEIAQDANPEEEWHGRQEEGGQE